MILLLMGTFFCSIRKFRPDGRYGYRTSAFGFLSKASAWCARRLHFCLQVLSLVACGRGSSRKSTNSTRRVGTYAFSWSSTFLGLPYSTLVVSTKGRDGKSCIERDRRSGASRFLSSISGRPSLLAYGLSKELSFNGKRSLGDLEDMRMFCPGRRSRLTRLLGGRLSDLPNPIAIVQTKKIGKKKGVSERASARSKEAITSWTLWSGFAKIEVNVSVLSELTESEVKIIRISNQAEWLIRPPE